MCRAWPTATWVSGQDGLGLEASRAQFVFGFSDARSRPGTGRHAPISISVDLFPTLTGPLDAWLSLSIANTINTIGPAGDQQDLRHEDMRI